MDLHRLFPGGRKRSGEKGQYFDNTKADRFRHGPSMHTESSGRPVTVIQEVRQQVTSCGQAVAYSQPVCDILIRENPGCIGSHPNSTPLSQPQRRVHSVELKKYAYNRVCAHIPSFAFVRGIGHLAGRCELVHRAAKVFLKHGSLLEEYRGFLYSSKPK